MVWSWGKFGLELSQLFKISDQKLHHDEALKINKFF